MKRANIILIIILLVVTAESRGQRQASNENIITVDVRKSYSQKKELILQDFMDVEYVALETNDDFLNQGFVLDIGKKFILVKNRINDGNIFIYDRAGKALRKINRKGQGPEEYTFILDITLDEDNEEMFVNDTFGQKIVVYDLYGKFERSFKYKEGTKLIYYASIFNYDKDNLICYNGSQSNNDITFLLLSKQNGDITKEIKIPFKEKKSPVISSDSEGFISPGHYKPVIPYKGNWTLLEYSADTVYIFLPDKSLHSYIVRTPSMQSMNPEVILALRLISDRYYFFETIKNEFDLNTRTGFPRTFFAYDKQKKEFFGYNVYNGDYSIKKEIYMNALRPVNHEIVSWQPIEAHQLVESYEKGELKAGKLKDIAAKLDPEDNPVIMLVKHKK